jgi:FkbM family methyltransferase
VTPPKTLATNGEAGAALLRPEERLRALHELRPEARLQAGVETPYVGFLRAVRERHHPRGVRDMRTLTLPDGLTFQVDLGDHLGCDVFYGYFEERFVADLFEEILRDGDTMLDVGANFGYYAVRCARAVGPSGVVHAFEPDPAARELLTANVAANRLDGRLQIHPVAVADQDRQVAFHLAEEAAFSGLTSTGRAALRDVVPITARSLDSFTDEHQIEAVDALKIDVEGHEQAVLRGAASLLRRSPDPLVMLEVSAKNLSDESRAALADEPGSLFGNGYQTLVPDLGAASGLREIETADEATSLSSANLLLVRPRGSLARRIRAAVARRLGSGDTPVVTPMVDDDPRTVRLFKGLDPDLVSAALRDNAEAESRLMDLSNEVRRLRGEITRMRTERAALRAEVRRLGATPLGMAARATRRLVRAVSHSAKQAP